MNERRRFIVRTISKALFLFILAGCWSSLHAQVKKGVDPKVAKIGEGFTSNLAKVNGTTLHYVRGGSGPAIILIHGFPEDWYEYHKIMPRLAKRFDVIAVDLRGIGGSSPTSAGYDAANLAEDIHQLARQLGLEHIYVVGHDIGGMVAYAFVRRYPQVTRGAMILDIPIPGIDGWDEILGDPGVWHIHFMQVPGLAEKLVSGRTADFLGYFFNFGKFTREDIAHYKKSYGTPARFRAALEIYRAFPANAKFNSARRDRIDVPLFLAAGDGSPFLKLLPKMAESLRTSGFSSVQTGVVPGSVHFLFADQPNTLTDLIVRYASPNANESLKKEEK